MKTLLIIVALVASGGLTAWEVTRAFGDGAVDEHVVREPVRAVELQAEAGTVSVRRRSGEGVAVRVERHHLVNTPQTSRRVTNGVLRLETTCALGLLSCRSDYEIGVPAGVPVRIAKSSGSIDAFGRPTVRVEDASGTVTRGNVTIRRR